MLHAGTVTFEPRVHANLAAFGQFCLKQFEFNGKKKKPLLLKPNYIC